MPHSPLPPIRLSLFAGFSLLSHGLNAAELRSSDGAANDRFGNSVSLSGNSAIVGARFNDIGANSNQGSAYLFRNLDTATGTVTETARLATSDGAAGDQLGISVSLSGNSGIVGAFIDNIGANTSQGSAYLFRNLDTATGTITESAKLIASDGGAVDQFGGSVSLSGNSAIVAARFHDVGSIINQGAAYLFRNLDAVAIIMGESSSLAIEGDHTGDGALFTYLSDTILQVWTGAALEILTVGNQSDLLRSTFTGGYTTFTGVPEPSAAMLSMGSLFFLLARRRPRRQGQ